MPMRKRMRLSAIPRHGWRRPKGLARAIDLTVADSLIAPISQIRPATYLGKGKVEEILGLINGHDIELVVMDCALSPIQQRNLEKAWRHKGARPYRTDPRNLRPPRQDQGRCAAGRACASELSAQPAGAIMDPSGAPARRFRLHGRPRRDPDRGRPPPDRRPHHAPGERNQEGAGDATAASRRPPAGAVSRRRAGRLHQRRQVDACSTA